MRYGTYKVNQDIIQESVRQGVLLEESVTELLFNERIVATLLKRRYTNKDFIGTDTLRVVIAEGYIHLRKHIEKWRKEPFEAKLTVYRALNRCVSVGWNRSRPYGKSSVQAEAGMMAVWNEDFQHEQTMDWATERLADEFIDRSDIDLKYFESVVEQQLGRDAMLFYKLRSKGYSWNEINSKLSIDGRDVSTKFWSRKYRYAALRKIAEAYRDII